VASFAAYEGLLFVIKLVIGMHASVFAFPVVARIFAINAAAFGVLFAVHALGSRVETARRNALLPTRHA